MSYRVIRITVFMIFVIIGIFLLINLILIPGLGGVRSHPAYPPPLTPTNPGPYPPSGLPLLLSTPTSRADNSSPDDSALMLDAQMYATDQNISLEEAVRRLKIQEGVGELNAELALKEKATFCGLWIQHQPDFRVIICFTHDGNNTIQPYIENRRLADIIEISSAKVSLNSLEKVQSEIMQICKNLEIPFNSSLNLEKNIVNLYVLDPIMLGDALQAADLQLPDNVQVIKVDELAGEN
jgi:hypothetical protein